MGPFNSNTFKTGLVKHDELMIRVLDQPVPFEIAQKPYGHFLRDPDHLGQILAGQLDV